LRDKGTKVASKHLEANKIKAYSDNSSPSAPSTPETPLTSITPGSEDTSTEEEGGLLHLIGRKVAQRKAKEKVEDPILDIMTKELL